MQLRSVCIHTDLIVSLEGADANDCIASVPHAVADSCQFRGLCFRDQRRGVCWEGCIGRLLHTKLCIVTGPDVNT